MRLGSLTRELARFGIGVKKAWVYILECSDGTYYTGYSRDPEARFAQHQAGRASRYTRTRLPVKMVFLQECPTSKQAYRAERKIKLLPREKKEALARGEHSLASLL
ncbi:MAG: GIY-YIG nuclease family protein [Anaerolineales bacterium]